MVPKLMKGRSFKGAAAYLLHDVHDHDASARVSWTLTRNLATRNPETAWKVMAATALDADILKERAGVKNTGRKAVFSVMHLVLSWHPDEAEALSRDDMIAAAESAITALGGSDRQALIIGHNDSAHPHLHILLNRHSPINGIILSSSKEKYVLSQWAQKYEEERGRIFCEDRVLNNEARKRGEYTRAQPDLPRQIVDAAKILRSAANDNTDKATVLRQEHLAKIRALGADTRRVKARHQDAWAELQASHARRRAAIQRDASAAMSGARSHIVETFRPAWRDLRAQEVREDTSFNAQEATTLGKLRNLFRSLDIARSVMEGKRPSIVSQIWRGLFSSEERKAMLSTQQEARRTALLSRQKSAIRASIVPIATQKRLEEVRSGEQFQAERSSLIFTHRAERAKLRAEWRNLQEERSTAFRSLSASRQGQQAFNEKAKPANFYERLKSQVFTRDQTELAREQDNDRNQERD